MVIETGVFCTIIQMCFCPKISPKVVVVHVKSDRALRAHLKVVFFLNSKRTAAQQPRALLFSFYFHGYTTAYRVNVHDVHVLYKKSMFCSIHLKNRSAVCPIR